MKRTQEQAGHYLDLVDSWVLQAVVDGTGSFDDLVLRLPGVFPADVAASVHRLKRTRLALRPRLARLLPQRGYQRSTVLPPYPLPLPHPLDYDWRFTPATSEFLWQKAVTLARSHDTVICLGTPSVFYVGTRRSRFRAAMLLDANVGLISHFRRQGRSHRLLECDVLTGNIPAVQAPVIVADPPWYGEHMEAFIWAASKLCIVGGYVLMSLPPRGTRPGADEDVERALGVASTMGFETVSMDGEVLEYDSPPFERNALRASGIQLASYTWRRGDLFVFRYRRATTQPRPSRRTMPCSWVSVGLPGMQARLRPNGSAQFLDPALLPLVEGDVLPSVSRRHPLRALVDVWTGGNRVFRCAGTNVLHAVFSALAQGQDPTSQVASMLGRKLANFEARLVSKSAEQVLALADQERADFCFAGCG